MARAKPCGLKLNADQLARIAAAQQRKGQTISPAVRIGGQALTKTQRDRLAEAEALAGGGLEERRKAAALVRQVEAELRAVREAAAVRDGIAQTVGRDRAAFEVEVVEVAEWRRDGDGALVRVKGRPSLEVRTVRRARRVDGLRTLHRAGLIDDAQLETADRYRALYAAAQPPVGTAALDAAPGAWRDPEAPMAAAMERGYAADWLGRVRRTIGPAAATVLEAVAGRGESLRALAAGGKQWRSNHALLTAALASLNLLFRAEEKKEIYSGTR